jgi:hypothetical protein
MDMPFCRLFTPFRVFWNLEVQPLTEECQTHPIA